MIIFGVIRAILVVSEDLMYTRGGVRFTADCGFLAIIEHFYEEYEEVREECAEVLEAIGTAKAKAALKNRRCTNWRHLQAGVD